ncbi:hypothetical protein DIPPA_06943 [Diplonema papillatum]|nr:hypothetical protein DIPPA_06943 [Diplonema papillatum]
MDGIDLSVLDGAHFNIRQGPKACVQVPLMAEKTRRVQPQAKVQAAAQVRRAEKGNGSRTTVTNSLSERVTGRHSRRSCDEDESSSNALSDSATTCDDTASSHAKILLMEPSVVSRPHSNSEGRASSGSAQTSEAGPVVASTADTANSARSDHWCIGAYDLDEDDEDLKGSTGEASDHSELVEREPEICHLAPPAAHPRTASGSASSYAYSDCGVPQQVPEERMRGRRSLSAGRDNCAGAFCPLPLVPLSCSNTATSIATDESRSSVISAGRPSSGRANSQPASKGTRSTCRGDRWRRTREKEWVSPKRLRGSRLASESLNVWEQTEGSRVSSLAAALETRDFASESGHSVDPARVVARLYPSKAARKRHETELQRLHEVYQQQQGAIPPKRAPSRTKAELDKCLTQPLHKKVDGYEGYDKGPEYTFRPKLTPHDMTSEEYSKMNGPVWQRLAAEKQTRR